MQGEGLPNREPLPMQGEGEPIEEEASPIVDMGGLITYFEHEHVEDEGPSRSKRTITLPSSLSNFHVSRR